MSNPRKVLVVVAHPDEARHLPPEADVVITGVGMVAAASSLTATILERDLEQLRAEWVILNLGTAGAVKPGLTGTVCPGAIINRDVDEDAARAVGLPESKMYLDSTGPVLGTGDSFIMDETVAAQTATRCDLVDMEGYAMAWVANTHGIPFRCVKHISDQADADAADWDENVHSSAAYLGVWYRRTCPGNTMTV